MSNVAIQIWGEWDIGFGDIGFDHLGMLCGWSRKKFHPSWVWERVLNFAEVDIPKDLVHKTFHTSGQGNIA
jgi:hypothetical protein